MNDLEKQLEEYKKMNETKNAFISGIIIGWASRIEHAELTHSTKEMVRVIDDMKEVSTMIAKSAGVTIADEKEHPK